MRKLMRSAVAAAAVLTLVAGNSFAAGDLAPQLVFVDDPIDTELAEATPGGLDLISGSIAESETELIFMWEVVDILDVFTHGVPEVFRYYFEFTLDDPDGVEDPVPFGLAVLGHRNSVSWTLNSTPCETTGNVVSCSSVPGARGTASIDSATNTITARMHRSSFKDRSTTPATPIAVDGSVLLEADLVNGIASYQLAGAVWLAIDQADMNISEDGSYILGSPR